MTAPLPRVPAARGNTLGIRARALQRKAEAHVHPGQHADRVRVRIAQRQALADERLEADAELEPAVHRLAAVPDQRRAEGRRAGTCRECGPAPARARYVDGSSAQSELEDVVAVAETEIAGDH